MLRRATPPWARRFPLCSLGFSLGLAVCAASPSVHAQPARVDRFALDTYDPPPAGDRFFHFESAEMLGHGQVDASLVTDLSFAPLRLRDASDETHAIVAAQIFEHLGVAVTLWSRLKLSVDMPLGASFEDRDVTAPVDETEAHFALGDLRTGLRLRLFGEPGDELRASVAGAVWLPTGTQDHFAGEGAVRGSPTLLLDGREGPLTWGFSGGVVFRPEVVVADATLGRAVTLGAGLGLSLGDAGTVSFESKALVGLAGPDAASSKTTAVELLLGWKYRMDDIVVGPAIGLGLTSGLGTPLTRAILSIAYAPLDRATEHESYEEEPEMAPPAPIDEPLPPPLAAVPERDSDGDGIVDRIDRCPMLPGPTWGDAFADGCPDSDGDGIADPRDACPRWPGNPDASPEKNGCPPGDRDRDGLLDESDTCPDEAGPPSENPMENGCPRDADRDGIYDSEDACPNEHGRMSLDPGLNGCPIGRGTPRGGVP